MKLLKKKPTFEENNNDSLNEESNVVQQEEKPYVESVEVTKIKPTEETNHTIYLNNEVTDQDNNIAEPTNIKKYDTDVIKHGYFINGKLNKNNFDKYVLDIKIVYKNVDFKDNIVVEGVGEINAPIITTKSISKQLVFSDLNETKNLSFNGNTYSISLK